MSIFDYNIEIYCFYDCGVKYLKSRIPYGTTLVDFWFRTAVFLFIQQTRFRYMSREYYPVYGETRLDIGLATLDGCPKGDSVPSFVYQYQNIWTAFK